MKKVKKIPIRTCVVSRTAHPKSDLLRIVIDKTGEVNIDTTGKMNGRGAYIFLTRENVENARKKKILEKVLKTSDLTLIYDKLEEMLNE